MEIKSSNSIEYWVKSTLRTGSGSKHGDCVCLWWASYSSAILATRVKVQESTISFFSTLSGWRWFWHAPSYKLLSIVACYAAPVISIQSQHFSANWAFHHLKSENRCPACPAAQHAQHTEIIYHPTYMTRNLPSDVKLKLYVILSLNTGGLKAKPLTFNSLIHWKAEPNIYNCISLNLQSLQPRICWLCRRSWWSEGSSRVSWHSPIFISWSSLSIWCLDLNTELPPVFRI